MRKMFLIFMVAVLVAGCGGSSRKGINIAQDSGGEAKAMSGISVKALNAREKYYFTAPFTEFGYYGFVPVDNNDNPIVPEEAQVEWTLENNELGTLGRPSNGDENTRVFKGTTDGQTTVTATRLDTGESATARIVVFPAIQLDYNQQGIGRGIVLSDKRQTYIEGESDIWLTPDRKSLIIPGGYVQSLDWEMQLEWLENPTLNASQIGTDPILVKGIDAQNPYLVRDRKGDVWAIYGGRRGFAFTRVQE